MSIARGPLARALSFVLALALIGTLPAFAQQRPRMDVQSYDLDADLAPKTGRLTARAAVTFTALEDLNVAVFELHNALRVTRVTDASGRTLQSERSTQDSTVRVQLTDTLAKGSSTTLTFRYEGALTGAQDSPVEGLKLASIGEGTTYLLYASRWFPLSGYGTDTFTARMDISAPAGVVVIGSGATNEAKPAPVAPTPAPAATPAPATKGKGRARARAKQPAAPAPATEAPFARSPGNKIYSFAWMKPSFPGTIIVGSFTETTQRAGAVQVTVYTKPDKKELARDYAETALKEFEFFAGLYGLPLSSRLQVVELPDDTVPAAWAPEIAALASRAFQAKTNYRLLAETIAHQWWGVTVAPATRNDWWISDGLSRYSEIRYVENVAGPAAFEEATKDMSVGALAYDNLPLSSIGKLDVFSPEFQSLSRDKGGMIAHMLRWSIGPANFDRTLRSFATQFAARTATGTDFQQVAEKESGEKLTAFFSQWLDGTGAPEFKTKYTVYRASKGFRIVGEISQDLDLFRMPLEVRVDTDGKAEMKRIEVVGTSSPFSIETFGKPRRIELDPNNWVLKNSPDLKVRVSILRGQQLVQQGDLTEALKEYQRALEVNKNSSLAHYRIAEVFFLQRNYQAAANAYRESLQGDNEPRWTEVWSHIQLGKIFDVTGQRERATNEYRQALATRDDTQGAQAEANKYLQEPYQRERNSSGN